MKYDKVIGIDLDVSKSDVAILNMEDKSLKVENLTFPQLIKLLMQNKAQCNYATSRENLCVVVIAHAKSLAEKIFYWGKHLARWGNRKLGSKNLSIDQQLHLTRLGTIRAISLMKKIVKLQIQTK